mgnify:CR=1 FL=1|tara:strand:+ start:481 stop:906 length:426 start_codon:yes stop_codon:yes gene_type:complete
MRKNVLKSIKIKSLKIIKMPEGNIMHVLKKKELKNWTLAEAYFSKIKYGKIKAWKFHKKMTLNLTVPIGKVKFVFYSFAKKKFKVITAGEKKYIRLIVPPKIWFGFKGLGKPLSVILNLANFNHTKKEILRKRKKEIKFNW